MNIRNLTIADYEKVYSLWTSTHGVGMRNLDDSKEGIEKFISRNPRTSYVAEIDERIVAVIMCGHDGRRGYIYHATVDKSYRNKGLGKKILNKALAALKQEGIHKAALIVYKTNEIGNAFWEAAGFELRDDIYYRNRSLNELNF